MNISSGQKNIIIGVIFLALALFFMKNNGISIWNVILLLLSIFDIGYGIYKWNDY